MAGPVRVFIACSLDGFIAGRDNDLSWLPAPQGGEDYGYHELLGQTSAILLGRGTYDVAAGFTDWPYAEMPVFVATRRALEPYLDGGNLIRSFLDEGLIDELTVTIVDVILGAGVPLFAGVTRRHRLKLTSSTEYPNGLVQLRYTPCRSG